MPMSNIQSVHLNGGALKIIGEITGLQTYDSKSSVLHVWLAQPACPGNAGAGLAINCFALDPTQTGDTPTPTFVSDGDKFRLTVPERVSTGSGVVGKFFQGPATVSVIALLYENGAAAQVLQWSRIAMLPEGTDHVLDAAFDAAADKAAALRANQVAQT
jgi:hypothetical protein